MTTAASGTHARLRECVFSDEELETLVRDALETAQYCWERNKVDHFDKYLTLATALHQSHQECLALRQRIGDE